MSNPFETDLPRQAANYSPLSPISFLSRSALVHKKGTSVIHGERRWTWAETPCAFVVVKPGISVQEKEVIKFCRSRLAGFKVPKKIVFSELPKTLTGKIRKSVLREHAKQI